MKIQVTQAHIDKGNHCAGTCPVALALREATGLNSCVFQKLMLWKDGNNAVGTYDYNANTPSDVLSKICRYDHGGGMEPFEFEIDYEVPL